MCLLDELIDLFYFGYISEGGVFEITPTLLNINNINMYVLCIK